MSIETYLCSGSHDRLITHEFLRKKQGTQKNICDSSPEISECASRYWKQKYESNGIRIDGRSQESCMERLLFYTKRHTRDAYWHVELVHFWHSIASVLEFFSVVVGGGGFKRVIRLKEGTRVPALHRSTPACIFTCDLRD